MNFSPFHGDGDEILSFSPSILHSTLELPNTEADPAQIASNTAMDMDFETLCRYLSSSFDDFESLSSLPPESSQMDLSEVTHLAAPADAPEDRRPGGTDADIIGVNAAAAPQAAPPVPVGGGGQVRLLDGAENSRRATAPRRKPPHGVVNTRRQSSLAIARFLSKKGKHVRREAAGLPRAPSLCNRLGSAVLTLNELRQITNNFSSDQLIGQGGFGDVYKGVLSNGYIIAVKKFRSAIPGLQDVQYENEAQHLMRLKHRNIVQLVGYCSETAMEFVVYNGKLVRAEKLERLLCMEYMPKGSLRGHLSDETSGLDWNTRYKIIKSICYGLHYLHEEWQTTPIIHMDLKPANILLDDNMVPKIADFGFSRLFGEEQTRAYTKSRMGTQHYMPPEYLDKGLITKKFDIFSLGVTIIEIITGLRDYPTDETETSPQQYIDFVLNNWRHRPRKAQEYTSQDIDYQQIKNCIQIGLLCVKFDWVKRPTTNQIIKMLETSDEAYQNEREVTNNFSHDQLLDKGGFSKVYKGVLRNGDAFAVKRFASTITGLQDVQYENEAQHLMRLKHPNILQLVGYCSETEMKRVQHNGSFVCAEKSERLLFLEYMPNGSLCRHLSDETSGLDWNTRYEIIKGICSGLYYLHECQAIPIIHMDLKPASIFLDDNMVPKIADFGILRLFGEEKTGTSTTSCKGTPGYMAPEYLEKDAVTKRSDIFSLGATIMEIITGRKDFPKEETETASHQYIDLVLNNWRHRPTKAQGYTSQDIDYQQIKKCIQIGLLCVKFDPVKRPTIKQIIKMLERSHEAYQNEREEEAQEWFDLWKSAVLQDLFPEVQPDAHSRTSFQKFNLEELRSRLSSWERMNSRELPDSKGVYIVTFVGPDWKGRKLHQGQRWKEKSIKGMCAVADPSSQRPAPGQQQQRYVGFKKTLELDDDGEGNKWCAHEYTPLLPSDDDSSKLVPAGISLRVEFKEDEPLSSSSTRKRSRSGAPKDGPKTPVESPVWERMTRVHVKAATTNDVGGSQRKKPCYKVMYAICHDCNKVFNADSGHGTNNLSKHLDNCKDCKCPHSHSR